MRAFDPWIGLKYETEGIGGTRLLVLGESQYPGAEYVHLYPGGAPTAACRSSTQEIVRDLAIENRNRFFTKVAKIVLGLPAGRRLPSEVRVDFWERIAFYNYVQWWLGGARFRPSPELWLAAQSPFLEVLSELRPHVLLVLGNELSRWLPTLPTEIEAVKIPHPSSKGFSYDPWSDSIRLALDRPNKAAPSS